MLFYEVPLYDVMVGCVVYLSLTRISEPTSVSKTRNSHQYVKCILTNIFERLLD